VKGLLGNLDLEHQRAVTRIHLHATVIQILPFKLMRTENFNYMISSFSNPQYEESRQFVWYIFVLYGQIATFNSCIIKPISSISGSIVFTFEQFRHKISTFGQVSFSINYAMA
jgi:hypothetical protein